MTLKSLGMICAGTSLILASCSSAKVEPKQVGTAQKEAFAARKKAAETSPIIAPGFTIEITHSADSSLSGDYKVDFAGMLKLPLKKEVHAAGLTPQKLAESLRRLYAPYFKVKDEVTVDIAARDYLIEVRGLINKPGLYPVKLDTSIEEVISMAGGMPGARPGETTGNVVKPEYARIVQTDPQNPEEPPTIQWIKLGDYFVNYDTGNEILWQGGERVFFQLAGDPKSVVGTAIQVLGEVRQPGSYAMQQGSDLLSYIEKAGGPTGTADLSRVVVYYKSRSDSKTFDLSGSTTKTEVAPGDVILVSSTNVRPGFVERFGSLIVSLGNLAISALILALTL